MRKFQINLLQKKDKSIADKLLYFLLHYLRYILVLTQIVVIGVFFFRIMVDQEIVELKESVDQKREIIRVSSPIVKEAEAIRNRSSEAEKIMENQNTFLSHFNYVFSKIPQGLMLSNFEVNEKSIKLSGLSVDSGRIRHLYGALQEEQQFKEVIINNIVKSNLGFEFSISILI